jgi:hypothetical protein
MSLIAAGSTRRDPNGWGRFQPARFCAEQQPGSLLPVPSFGKIFRALGNIGATDSHLYDFLLGIAFTLA